MDNLTEIIKNTCFRYKSVLSLPSKDGNYYDTIMKVLTYVKIRKPDLEAFSRWFCEEFSVIDYNAYNSRKILERANLIRTTAKNNIVLTIDGEQCFISNSREIIAKGFLEAFVGFLEILFVISEHRNISRIQLFKSVFDQFEQTFESKRQKKSSQKQFCIIIRYLKSFGLIKVNGRELEVNTNIISKILTLLSI